MGGSSIDDLELNIESFMDLDTIHFHLDYADDSNCSLIDTEILIKKLSTEVKSYLEDRGFKCFDEGFPGKGGGADVMTFVDFIKTLWSHKDIILFLVSFYKWLGDLLLQHVKKYFEKMHPRLILILSINSTAKFKKLTNDDLNFILTQRLANLINTGQAICTHINQTNTFLKCDLYVIANIIKKDYSIRFYLDKEHQDDIFIARFINIMKNFVIKKGICSIYSFSRFGLILRADNKMKFQYGGSSHSSKIKKYYLWISSRILSDYLYKD